MLESRQSRQTWGTRCPACAALHRHALNIEGAEEVLLVQHALSGPWSSVRRAAAC